MAYSLVNKVATGASNTFTVNFALDYLDIDEVTAWVTGELDGLGAKVYRTITPISTNILSLSGALIGAGLIVVFTRTVPADTLVVDFQNDKVINEDTLNTAQKQALMLVHQVLDGRFAAFQSDIDMGGFRLRNAADAALAQDYTTLAQLQAAQLASGNFILPGAGNTSRVPTALSSTTYAWRQLLRADLSDSATAFDFQKNIQFRSVTTTPDAPTAADNGKVIYYSGAASVVNLPTLAAFGDGKLLLIKNVNGTTITINRAGSDTFQNAATSVVLQTGGYLALISVVGNSWLFLDCYNPQPNSIVMDTAGGMFVDKATAAIYWANSQAKPLPVDQVWLAAAPQTFADASPITLNMATFINCVITLNVAGATRQLANPTNVKVGQSGCLLIAQDGTGSRLMTFGTNWKFPFGTAFTLSTTANAIDLLTYYCHSATYIVVTGIKSIA